MDPRADAGGPQRLLLAARVFRRLEGLEPTDEVPSEHRSASCSSAALPDGAAGFRPSGSRSRCTYSALLQESRWPAAGVDDAREDSGCDEECGADDPDLALSRGQALAQGLLAVCGQRTWRVRAPFLLLLVTAAVMVPVFGGSSQRWLRGRFSGKAQLQLQEDDNPKFQKVTQGTCGSNGMFPITDQAVCQAAARALALPDVVAEGTMEVARPQGCYWMEDKKMQGFNPATDGLWFGLNPGSAGKGADTTDLVTQQYRSPICTNKVNCGVVEDGVKYAGDSYTSISHIDTPGLCCEKCQADWRCGVWSLDKQAQLCYFFRHTADYSRPDATILEGWASGVPHRPQARNPDSLYCVALMQPDSYEMALLKMQHAANIAMFACDEWAIYSNRVIELASGVKTAVIDSDLKCNVGGDAGTALNTGIFIAFWNKVILDGQFRFNEWTVKVDPDAVFFPERLRGLVRMHHDGEKGVYLNNCKYGLHGPIEVFSRKAMETYAMNYKECEHKLWFAFTHWGEDMFMDQCMEKVIHIQRDDAFALICEDHCDCPSYTQCNNGAVVFHPFKTEDSFRKCMSDAGEPVL